MLRITLVACLLLLAGCASPPVDQVAPVPAAEPTVTVTATRVEAHPHPVDWHGQIAERPCAADGSEDCRGMTLVHTAQPAVAIGLTWDEPSLTFRDPRALFWRVNVELAWESDAAVPPSLELEVRTVVDCLQCRSRSIETFTGESPIVLEKFDVFLQEHDVGVELVLHVPDDAMMETTAGNGAIHFDVDGVVAGYLPVGEPILLNATTTSS